jgi:hypothetical protein
VGYGGFTWLAVFGLGQRATGQFNAPPRDAITSLVSNLAYGVAASQFILRLGDPRLFPDFDPSVESCHDNELWVEESMVDGENYLH